MKKIINKVENIVDEMCYGIVFAHQELEYLSKHKIVKKKLINENKVTLISGGGSGHEPAHAGFVGDGMIDVAVCGDVFASPSQIQVYEGIKSSVSNKGTLLIIKNYSGDMMNFQNAMYLANEDGIEVDYVKVDDDVAVKDSLYTVGKRGVAGCIFVHKVAGAAANKGYDLAQVKEVASKVSKNIKSIGFAFESCTVPAKGTPTFKLGADEMEYGVGIHGEPGIKKEKILSADELAKKMLDDILAEITVEKNEVAVLVNGFGATPLQELYLLNYSVVKELSNRNVKVVQTFVGNYMTSIDMQGASITIFKLDDETKHLLFSDCNTPAFKLNNPVLNVNYYEDTKLNNQIGNYSIETSKEYSNIENNVLTRENIIYIIDKMSEVIIENEVPFCELDSHAGDGDFGMSVAKGFKQLKNEWQEIITNNLTIDKVLEQCSLIIMEHCGGASGPIWGSAFRGASKSTKDLEVLNVVDVANMLEKMVESIQITGERSFGRGAKLGDKTLLDALIPCANEWKKSVENNISMKEAFINGAIASVEGAKTTETFAAKMGRAGTVGDRSIGYPDAGAHALGVIFTEIAKSLN